MLLITFEIVPFGQWDDRYPIQKVYIANVGGNSYKANYHAWIDVDPTENYEQRPEPHFIIKNFHRQEGATELLRKVLNRWYSKKSKEKRHANKSNAK